MYKIITLVKSWVIAQIQRNSVEKNYIVCALKKTLKLNNSFITSLIPMIFLCNHGLSL